VHELQLERRRAADRRRTTFAAWWHGTLRPRRRSGGRRNSDRLYPIVDWHSPRVLVGVIAILGLCVLDGVLTVMLMSHGATEENPVMALFLPHDLGLFAAVKLTLTSFGLIVLVACSRMRLFRAIPGEALIYIVMAGYVALVTYELELLKLMPSPNT
jgi:MFS superfamily sulfate permease-like transporter